MYDNYNLFYEVIIIHFWLHLHINFQTIMCEIGKIISLVNTSFPRVYTLVVCNV